MKNNSIKNLFIAGLTLLSFGFLSAQFVIPSGINNTLQIIQSVLVTTSGTSTGNVIMHTNTGVNNIYINPAYLPIVVPYSGSYVLTLNASGYVSLTNMTDFIQNNSFTTNGSWAFGGDTVFNDSVTFSTGPVLFNNTTTTFSGGTVNNINTTINNNSGTVINSTGTTFNNTNTTVSNTNVTTTNNGGSTSNTNTTVTNTNITTNNNGGTTNNTNNTVNNSGTVINNTGVTNNNYSGTVTNYHTGSTVVYHSGTTVVFQSGVIITGAAVVGPQGANGLTTLFLSTIENPGPNCAYGGYLISYGPDSNEDTLLNTWEVIDSFYLCHGEDGAGSPQMLSMSGDTILEISGGNDVNLGGHFWSLVGNWVDNANKILGTLNDYALRIVTNNLERITILGGDSTTGGYVGINNTNPEKRLHVNGAIASSLIKVSTSGTNIDLFGNFSQGHYETFNDSWNDFVSYHTTYSTNYYTPDGKAFFFPLPQGTNFFGGDDFIDDFIQYLVFIDVQDVNTVILAPAAGEAFFVGGFINGTAGQKLSVIQRDFDFDSSGNVQNISLGLPSPFFEAPATGEIISGGGPRTLDGLFSTITTRGSTISGSYKHFPSHPGLFTGGFTAGYNGAGNGDMFIFQVLDIFGVCNLPREFDEDVDDGMGTVCVRGTTYVYDGEYRLRTYGGL